MPNIKTFTINFLSDGEVVGILKVDAANKQDVKTMAEELRDTLQPTLNIHYESLGLPGSLRLKIFIY